MSYLNYFKLWSSKLEYWKEWTDYLDGKITIDQVIQKYDDMGFVMNNDV